MLRTPSWNDDSVSSCASHSGGASNDDITIDCKVRQQSPETVANPAHTQSSAPGRDGDDMLLTLTHWHVETLAHEALFMGEYAAPADGPQLVLRPVPRLPRRGKWRAAQTSLPSEVVQAAYTIALHEIASVTVCVSSRRLVLHTKDSVLWHVACRTANGAALLCAALQSRLPPQQWHVTEPLAAARDASMESCPVSPRSPLDMLDVDSLTNACIRATAAQEGWTGKLSRRWGKAVHELTQPRRVADC